MESNIPWLFSSGSSVVELKERAVRLVENIFHHVHLAAVETIGGMVLQLPFSPQHRARFLPFWQVGELLKLIDADDNLDAFSFGYPFGELQNVFRTFPLGFTFRLTSTLFIGSEAIVMLGVKRLINFTKSDNFCSMWRNSLYTMEANLL